MYQRVKAHPGVRTIYAERVVKEGVIDEAGVNQLIEERVRRYEDALARAKAIAATQKSGTTVRDPRRDSPAGVLEPPVTHAQDARATELDGSEIIDTSVEV